MGTTGLVLITVYFVGLAATVGVIAYRDEATLAARRRAINDMWDANGHQKMDSLETIRKCKEAMSRHVSGIALLSPHVWVDQWKWLVDYIRKGTVL